MTENRQTYTISPDVLYTEMEDDVVLLHTGNSHYYGLDEVGARFWQLLVEDGDPESTIPMLLDEFDVDETLLRADLQCLLQELTEATILLPVA